MEARLYVMEWLRDKQEVIGVEPYKWLITDEYAEKFHAAYETTDHIVGVTCWNHADCLDIEILSKATGDVLFGEAGACDGTHGLEARLDRFLRSFQTVQT